MLLATLHEVGVSFANIKGISSAELKDGKSRSTAPSTFCTQLEWLSKSIIATSTEPPSKPFPGEKVKRREATRSSYFDVDVLLKFNPLMTELWLCEMLPISVDHRQFAGYGRMDDVQRKANGWNQLFAGAGFTRRHRLYMAIVSRRHFSVSSTTLGHPSFFVQRHEL